MSAPKGDPSPAGASGKGGFVAEEHDYPMVGETLGLWRLVRGLGRGGMGEVYEAEYDYVHLLSLRYGPEQRDVIKQELHGLARAEQARLAGDMLGTPLPPDARFAIKVCNARNGTAGHRRFLQEAEVAQRLGDHPYIVTVHALNGALAVGAEAAHKFDLERGKYRDVAFMVMDLAACDYDHTGLAIPDAVHIVRCIATALDHAHRHGVIHRDLKPENILGSIQHPLLTDFGIAKELDQTEGLTRTGQIIGTLDYMSPEQATDAKRVDHRSDIYSLGVVLYEMATQGSLPYFHKMDRESCLAAIRSERVEPKWPREYVPDFPVGLERIILKAMAQRMEDRYQAMSEFITDLDRYSRGEWLPLWGRIRVKSLCRHQLRRHPRIIWGTAGALLLTGLVALWLWALPLLDQHRRSLDEQLAYLEKVVLRIEGHKADQPSKDDQSKIDNLDLQMRGHGNRYPDQRQRREQLGRRLQLSRRLDARFAGVGRTFQPLTPDDRIAAMEQLQLAARVESPPWVLRDREGLSIQEDTRLNLMPYGAGTVCSSIQVRTGEGFLLEVSEVDKPIRHVTAWQVRNRRLVLTHREDERPVVVLRDEALPGNGPWLLNLALEVTPERVRCWWPEKPHLVRGLVEGATARIGLHLPKDSVLVQIQVGPGWL